MSTANEKITGQGTPEAAFERYRSSDDVEALGQVVDELSPQLLGLAGRQSGGAAEMEDLVQATFLNAVVHRHRWDASRQLLPWLAGILIHQAQNQSRRRQVRATLPLLSEEQVADTACDPGELAALEDDRHAVMAAVDQLGEPYRELFSLRIEKGLNNRDLAKTLNRPEGTIRVQLARGRERLESLLPKDLRLAGLCLIPTEAVRERLRASIVEHSVHALGKSVLSAGTVAAGSTALTKAWMVLAVLAVGVGLWVNARDPESVADPALVAVDRVAEPEVAQGPPANAAEELANLVNPTSTGAPERSAPADRATFQVMVSYGEDGQEGAQSEVASGVGVYLQPIDRHTPGQTVETNEEGIAEFTALQTGSYAMTLGPVAGEPTVLAVDASLTVEASIPDGVDVAGSVLGFDGTPVAGANVYRIDPSQADAAVWLARTNAAGQFTARDVTPGVELIARAAGHQPSGGKRGRSVSRVRAAVGSRQEARLHLGAKGHGVTGRVLGPDGQPAPFALVIVAVDEDASEEPDGLDPLTADELRELIDSDDVRDTDSFLIRANAAGAFQTTEVPRGTASFIARSWDDPTLVGFTTLDVVGQSVTAVTLHLERGAEVHGRVTDNLGTPRQGVALEAEWKGTPLLGGFESGLGEEAMTTRVMTEADGSFSLAGLLPGETGLHYLGGTQARPREERVVLAAGDRHEWNPVVPVHTEIHVRGIDGAGKPLVGWEARCESDRDSIRVSGALVLDDEGRARFTGLRGEDRIVTLHPPSKSRPKSATIPTVHSVMSPSDEERTLRFDPSRACSVSGSIALPVKGPDIPTSYSVQLIYDDFEKCGVLDVGDGGGFAFANLPPGNYRLLCSAPMADVPRDSLLKKFTLAAEESIDLGELRPARGTVLALDVLVPPGYELGRRSIRLVKAANKGRTDPSFEFRRAAPGQPWRSEPLAPGTYFVLCKETSLGVQQRKIELRSDEPLRRETWALEVGTTVQWRIHFDRHPTTEAVRPRCEPSEGRVDFTLMNQDGNVLWDDRLTELYDSTDARIMTVPLKLAPGTYWVMVEDERFDGWDKSVAVSEAVVLPAHDTPFDIRLDSKR